MSLAVPFWNYFWHIIGLISVLLICLPTFYLARISKRLSIHRELVPEKVTDMRHGGVVVQKCMQRTLIDAYNTANFLYRKPYLPSDYPQFALTWDYNPRRESYAIYPNGPYVDVVKTKGKKHRLFTLQSQTLREWLDAPQP